MVWHFNSPHNYLFLVIKSILISGLIIATNASEYEIGISNQDLSIKIDEKANLTLTLNLAANETFGIKLTCNDKTDGFDWNINKSDCDVIRGLEEIYYINGRDNSIPIEIVGAEPGRQTLIAHVNNSFTNAKDAFCRINVGRTKAIDVISVVIGWLYFAAWSISFYPQIWINFKRKSVVGLNFDYIGLNITGFLCYSLFNVCLYFSPYIQNQFEEMYPRSQIPVELNDVVFALHAVFATLIVIFQCIIYERESQTVSLFAKAFLVIAWSAAAIIAIIVPTTHKMTWLSYLYFFSYVKLTITIIKYIPQAWYNYKRKSTIGWSIGNILLDFTGGSLSILQMFLLSYNYDDWLSIFKNFTKFGLGMISILFDILFIIQHYVLYRNASDSELTSLTNSSNRTSTSDLESFESD